MAAIGFRPCAKSVGGRPCKNSARKDSIYCNQHMHEASRELSSRFGSHAEAVKHFTNGNFTEQELISNVKNSSSSGNGGDSASEESWSQHFKYPLREEQQIVADKAFEVFTDPHKDRCQVRAACGMGKTMMEQASIQKYDAHLKETTGNHGTYLIVVPSIALAKQMRSDIENDGIIPGAEQGNVALDVHNESKDLNFTAKKDGKDVVDRDAQVKHIAEMLSQQDDGPRVVVACIDSIDKVIDAQKLADNVEFDVAMFDEAHNYAGEMYGKVNGKVTPIRPVYFNEMGDDALQAQNRMFLTASPKMPTRSQEMMRKPQGFGGKKAAAGTAKDAIIKMSTGEMLQSTIVVNQGEKEVFGEFVGDWGYDHAVKQGYLTRIDTMVAETAITSPDGTRPYTQRDKINLDGKLDADGPISVNAYASVNSTLDSLASEGGRNVLLFTDSIDDASDSANHWRGVAHARSRDIIGREMSLDECRSVIAADPASNSQETRAAKYRMLGEHAAVIATHSKSSEREKREALDHFDKEKDGELIRKGKCECGRPGGWCACARVVANYDMLSEGVSINSIDTVVFNRPSNQSDASITQAVGRASRKMKSQDKKARVVVPLVTQDQQPVLYAGTAKSLGAINRVNNDMIGTKIDESKDVPQEQSELRFVGDTTYSSNVRDFNETMAQRSMGSIGTAHLGNEENAFSNMDFQTFRSTWARIDSATKRDHQEFTGDKNAWDRLDDSGRETLVRQKATQLQGDGHISKSEEIIVHNTSYAQFRAAEDVTSARYSEYQNSPKRDRALSQQGPMGKPSNSVSDVAVRDLGNRIKNWMSFGRSTEGRRKTR